ncbi:MAG: CvpA family protein [Clostridia bacterium]|nr:CvpA family protein [Clostridia bacterium]MDE7328581.1 CvpA family protein [Clostridia bacterium]
MSYITIISLVVLVICLITGIIRGFVRALLRLISAIATCVLTLTLTPYLAKAMYTSSFAQGKSIPAAVYSGLSAIIILVGCSLVFGLITFIVHKSVSKSPLSGANRFLGALLYLLIGFAVLILVGYVINIFSDLSFMQPVVNDAQKDPFSNWLITNNLFNKFMEAVAKEGGVFQDFLNGFKSLPSGDMSSGDAITSGAIE